MAKIGGEFVITHELRPCLVGKERKKGLFHHWEDYSELIGESPLVGGHSAGQVSMTFGLVEFEDGEIKRIYPYEIKFIDNKFKDYCFEE